MKGALGMGRFSLKMLNTGDLEAELLCCNPVGYERKILDTGIPLHGGIVRQPGVGSSNGDFERLLKGSLEVGRLSLLELCEGKLEGGLPSWGPWRIGRKGSEDGYLIPQVLCWVI